MYAELCTAIGLSSIGEFSRGGAAKMAQHGNAEACMTHTICTLSPFAKL